MSTTALLPPVVHELERRRPRALIVEDDARIARDLVENLTADHVEAKTVTHGHAALEILGDFLPDIVLIDEGLPDMRGLDLITAIRAGDRDQGWDAATAIIVVTGKIDSMHAIRSMERGADDHVTKPYVYGELLARILATLRRTQAGSYSQRIEVGELTIDCTGLAAWNGETQVQLCAKEFALLVALARDPFRTFGKGELLRRVWGYPATAHRTRTLDTHASRVRRKLAGAGLPGMVHNVWGVGYRLLAVER